MLPWWVRMSCPTKSSTSTTETMNNPISICTRPARNAYQTVNLSQIKFSRRVAGVIRSFKVQSRCLYHTKRAAEGKVILKANVSTRRLKRKSRWSVTASIQTCTSLRRSRAI